MFSRNSSREWKRNSVRTNNNKSDVKNDKKSWKLKLTGAFRLSFQFGTLLAKDISDDAVLVLVGQLGIF